MEILNICSHISNIADIVNISKCCKLFQKQLSIYIQKYKSSWYFIRSIDTYYVHSMMYILGRKMHKNFIVKTNISKCNNKMKAYVNQLIDDNSYVLLEYTWSFAYPTNHQIFLHMNTNLKPDFRIFI